MINYTPFGFSDWQTEVSKIKTFGSAGKKTAVVSTINGDANVPFYKELGNQGIKATDIPVVAFSVGEEELAGLDAKPLVGHLAAWNYFESIKTPANEEFIKEWHDFTKNPKRTTNDPMEAHYIGFKMWVKAVEKAESTDPDKVIAALPGIEAPNLTGGISTMLPNHHITKPVYIGEIRADGQFDVVWKTTDLVPGDGLVALSARIEGHRRRLGHAQVRQLQQGHQEVRRRVILAVPSADAIDKLNVAEAAVVPPPLELLLHAEDMSAMRSRSEVCVACLAECVALLVATICRRAPRRRPRNLEEALVAFHRRRLQRDRRPASTTVADKRRSAGSDDH